MLKLVILVVGFLLGVTFFVYTPPAHSNSTEPPAIMKKKT
jgi:hypothetical protein